MKKLFKFLILLICLCSNTTYAVEIKDLYQVKVNIADNSAAARHQATVEGFKLMLGKVANKDAALSHPAVIASYNNLEPFVSSFAYQQDEQQNKQITIKFNQTLINQLLHGINQPVLGTSRPFTILWLKDETSEYGSEILSNDNEEFYQLLDIYAKQRSMPISLPLLDIDDQNIISKKDITNLATNKLKQASKRYHADIFISGTINKFADKWKSKWHMHTDRILTWNHLANSKEELIEIIINTAADKIIEKYATSQSTANSLQQVKLNVSGINNLNNYAAILNYLKKLSMVHQVEVHNLSSDNTMFLVHSISSIENLKNALKIDKMLVPLGEDSSNVEIELEDEQVQILNYKVIS